MCSSDLEFYFLHSYYPQPSLSSQVYAVAEYEIEFPVAIGHRNLFATQFHPEKSGPLGLQILKNFSEWDGGGGGLPGQFHFRPAAERE